MIRYLAEDAFLPHYRYSKFKLFKNICAQGTLNPLKYFFDFWCPVEQMFILLLPDKLQYFLAKLHVHTAMQ